MSAQHSSKHERQWHWYDSRRNTTINFEPAVSIYDLCFSTDDWEPRLRILGTLFDWAERRVYQIQQGVYLGPGGVYSMSLLTGGEMQLRLEKIPVNELWNGKGKLLDWQHDKTEWAFLL